MSNIRKTPHSSNISLQNNPYALATGLVDPDVGETPTDKAALSCPAPAETRNSYVSSPNIAALPAAEERFLTDRMVAGRYDVQKQTIWRWAKTSPLFPKPIKFEGGTTRWRLSDIIAYERQVMRAAGVISRARARRKRTGSIGPTRWWNSTAYVGTLCLTGSRRGSSVWNTRGATSFGVRTSMPSIGRDVKTPSVHVSSMRCIVSYASASTRCSMWASKSA